MTDNFSKLSFKNKKDLLNDFSCYCCRRYGKVSEIKNWADKGETALCPMCGVDAVVTGIVPELELYDAYMIWFGDDDGQ